MAIILSDWAKGTRDVAQPDRAGSAITVRYSATIPANIAVGDIIDLGVIPAGCRPVALHALDIDDIDSNGTPLVTFDVGMMSGDPGDTSIARTCGAEFFSASQLGRTGGMAQPTLSSAFRVARSDVQRSIGLKITAVAATPVVGMVGITVTYSTG